MHFPLAIATTLSLCMSALAASSAAPGCWASTTGVSANFGSLSDLHIDANQFCTQFATGAGVLSSAGRLTFGFQSAIFINKFTNATTCLSTFNSLIDDCYGTANPNVPVTLGGVRVDPGGAELVVSFGDGAHL